MNNAPTLDVNSWAGLVNKTDARTYGLAGMQTADNLRIDRHGKLRTRPGLVEASDTPFRGAFATADGRLAYAITTAGNLVRWPSETVLAGNFAGLPYWVELTDHVLVGNATQVWRVYLDGSVIDNAMARPEAPALELRTGSLPAGIYRFIAVDVGVEESAPSDQSSITVDGTQSIYVSAPGMRVYVCPANSTQFFQWRGSGIYSWRPEQLGATLETRGLWPMPNGDCLALYDEALYVSTYIPSLDLSAVWRSKGLWHGLCDIRGEGPELFAGQVRFMAGNFAGLLIATDREIGAISGERYTKFCDFGVAPGLAGSFDDKGTIHLLTQRGFATAFPFRMINDEFSPPSCNLTRTAVVREGGDERLIAMVSISGDPDNAA